MKHLLKLKAMGLLVFLLTLSCVQAQTVAPTRGDGLDNPQIQPAEYDAYKVMWVQENPGEYDLLLKNSTAKDDPNGSHRTAAWSSPEEKERWISEHPREYAELMEAQKAIGKAEVSPTMTRTEFNALPVGRQQAILNETNTRIIDNNTK